MYLAAALPTPHVLPTPPNAQWQPEWKGAFMLAFELLQNFTNSRQTISACLPDTLELFTRPVEIVFASPVDVSPLCWHGTASRLPEKLSGGAQR